MVNKLTTSNQLVVAIRHLIFAISHLPFAICYLERCPSGRRSTTGNRVGVNSVSWVQIPPSPPLHYAKASRNLNGLEKFQSCKLAVKSCILVVKLFFNFSLSTFHCIRYSQAFGPCATMWCEIRQVRKEATVNIYNVCRRIT